MTTEQRSSTLLDASDSFPRRHLGPREADLRAMLETLGVESLDALTDRTVPESIALRRPLALRAPATEAALLEELRAIAAKNQTFTSLLGMGYHGAITPPVILRNILENPGWYTQYTPYQAEISQGRLEALLNFQTVISDLTALPLAGASLLDEATAAAEAMAMCAHAIDAPRKLFVCDLDCHPQTLDVLRTRAEAIGVAVRSAALHEPGWTAAIPEGFTLCGALIQYPQSTGAVRDWRGLIERLHGLGALAVMAADPLALALLTPPGELGADIAVGSAQRLGVPMGFGGPHAGYLATTHDQARRLPGRIIGVSRDAQGATAYRMALQTREQHIRRERATSNICTAQALLAIMAGMYAVWHGPEGIRRIAQRVRGYALAFAEGARRLGHTVEAEVFFDTVRVRLSGLRGEDATQAALARRINLREVDGETVCATFDETTTRAHLADALAALDPAQNTLGDSEIDALLGGADGEFDGAHRRVSAYLTHEVFHRYRSETELLRYINKLRNRDLSLAQSMIPLGSCTMKLNATTEMIPVTWPEFGALHPFAPPSQTEGYARIFADLEAWLAEITGFAAVSLQPNAGSQGEYAGLLAIRAYHASRGDSARDVCLIPNSAHGTNPASAVTAGMRVVAVKCDAQGNVDLDDLRARAKEHAASLAAVMITYPSTHGVFEEGVKTLCEVIHAHGGLVYMDGANLNAQVGLCRPGDIGADVCHLNLHKTFCIPHGGGGPGMGPIAVAAHLAPFLPGHPVRPPTSSGPQAIGAISAAPYGSPSILTIPWAYIAMMGAEGLKAATQVAILNANYMAKRLSAHYPILYLGAHGFCAHEFILDLRPFEKTAGVKAEDVAKRLMDYGFHAPTMSFPVPGTLMIEPTESESKPELDRFCDAMIQIREEIRAVEEGRADRADNPLKHAPHTAAVVSASEWSHGYSRETAAFPLPWVRDNKFWPAVGRVDNPFGDRNLICLCPPMSDYAV
ncbi:MAG: aminomethyl-transferring glycine dehydrogenase [Polyangiales bacterium]